MRFLILLFSLFNFQVAFSQVTQSQDLTINLTLPQIESKIEEVYGSSFVENNPSLVQFFLKLFKERISYITQERTADEKYVKLSSLPLMNKNNQSITYDTLFSKLTFNPLKYRMNFYSNTTQVYRFDNSDILIVIAPQ
jgi:hypothetical protein